MPRFLLTLTLGLVLSLPSAAFAVAFVPPADFQPGTYILGNHPGGGAHSVHPYGLRLDDVLAPGLGLFDFEITPGTGVTLEFSMAPAPRFGIGGTIFHVQTSTFWNLDFVYTDPENQPGGDIALGAGAGAIRFLSGSWAGPTEFSLVAFQGRYTHPAFIVNGHRGFPGRSGFGWLGVAAGPRAGENPCSPTHTRTSTQDFLFTARRPVPEPGSAVLFVAGGLLVAGAARRRAARD